MKSGCWMAFGPYGDAPDGMAGTHANMDPDDDLNDYDADNTYPKDGNNVVVRKSALYESLPWGVDLYESLVAVAPFGGPIAVLPSDSSTITVYTSAGKSIRTFPVPRLRVKKAPLQLAGAASSFQHPSLETDIPEEIVVMGWNLEESLIALSLSGNVYAYSLSSPDLPGKPEMSYGGSAVCIAGGRWGDPEEELSPEDDPFSLCYALVGPSGIVVQDEQYRLKGVIYEERKEPTRFEVEMYDYIDDDIVAMDVIPRDTNLEREHTLIVAPGKKDTKVKGSLLLVNASDGVVTNLELQIKSGVNNIKRDRKGDFIALTTRDGRLLLTNGNIDRILFSFNLRCPGIRPSSIIWIGPDVVSLQYSRSDVDEYRYDDFSLLVCVKSETHEAARLDAERQKSANGGALAKGRTRSTINGSQIMNTSQQNASVGGGVGRTHSTASTVFGHDGGGIVSAAVGIGMESTIDSLSEGPHSLVQVINWGTEANGGLVRVVQEVDGMKAITEEGCYLVEQLPLVTVRTLRHNSQALTSRLIKAFSRYASHDDIVPLFKVKAQMTKMAGSVGSDCLGRVLDELLDVVVGQLDVTIQRLLLQVVSFVIPMVRGYESDKYVDVVKRLRVLNAIRHVNCGIPITHRQYEELAGVKNLRNIVGPEAQGVVDRLINRQEFQLALEVATLMNIRTQKLFVQWSCAKVLRASGSDEALKRELVSVLSNCPGASFIDAALTAFDVNRKELAISLLHEDPRPSNQVMLFLQMGQDRVALQRACESSDPDLILMVLMKLYKEGKHGEIIESCSEVAECVVVVEELGMINREWNILVGEHFRRRGRNCWSGYRLLTQLMLGHTYLGDTTPIPTTGHNNGADSDTSLPAVEDEDGGMDDEFGDVCDIKLDTPEVSAIHHYTTAAPAIIAAPPQTCQTFTNANGIECAYLEGIPGPRNLEGVEYLPDRDAYEAITSFEGTVNSFSAPNSLQAVCKDDCAWLRKHVQLMRDQRELCDQTGSSRFLNASINRTIQFCVEEGLEEEALRLKQQFKLKEAVFWHLKLRAYIESERWEDLDVWAGGGVQGQKSKIKSPIGFEPFVQALHDVGRYDQMAHFVRKLNGLVKRVEWFSQIERFDWAADEAHKEDDLDMLVQIKRYATDDRTANYIQSYIDDLA